MAVIGASRQNAEDGSAIFTSIVARNEYTLSGVESGLVDGFTNLGPGRPHVEGIFVSLGEPPIDVVAHSFQELSEGPGFLVGQLERNRIQIMVHDFALRKSETAGEMKMGTGEPIGRLVTISGTLVALP